MGKIIKIFLGLIVLLVLIVVVIISTFDVNQYKDDIIELVENNTHRKFDISGDLDLALSLIPTVVVEGVSFGNADWGSRKDMMTMDRLELQVSLMPLLKRTLQVNRLILLSPHILLETNQEGKGNWALELNKPEAAQPAVELPAFVVKQVVIDDAKITYRNGVTGKTTTVNLAEVNLAGSGYGDPVQLTVKASYNDTPVAIEGNIGSVKQLLENNNLPVSLSASLSNAALTVNGEVAQPMDAKGLDLTVSFQVDSLHSLSKLAGSELPEFGPIDFRGTLLDAGGGYAIKGMNLNAGPSELAGDVSINTAGERPELTARLSSKLIDVSGHAGAEEPEQKVQKDPNAKLFPATPLPLDGLRAADVDVSISAARIITDFAVMENTTLGLKLDDGKLTLTPFTATAAGGTLNSSITLDGSNGKTAALSARLNIKNLQPGLLPKLKDKVSGAHTDMDVRLNGSGGSVAEIMAGLNGKVLVKTGKGVLKSKDSDKESDSVMLKTFSNLRPQAQEEEQGTQIECYVMNLDIKDGIAAVDKNIALVTDKMNVTGSGIINFKNEQLDLGVTPEARKGLGINLGNLAELVRLKGTFANPQIGPDTKAALKAGLSAGAAVATGGISLLAQGLFSAATADADADPCATALGVKPAGKTAAETTQQPAQSTSSGPMEAVKDAGTKIKDTFKGLFGK
jgi:hypothetical protein